MYHPVFWLWQTAGTENHELKILAFPSQTSRVESQFLHLWDSNTYSLSATMSPASHPHTFHSNFLEGLSVIKVTDEKIYTVSDFWAAF